MPPNPRKDCPQLGGQTGQQLGLSCVHPGAGAEPQGVRTARAWAEGTQLSAHALRCPSPCELPGGQPTLELGKVSLKKVGSQERRMKKEQAAESWEMMAALGGGCQAQHPHLEPLPTPGWPGAESGEPSGAASVPAAPLWWWTQAPKPHPHDSPLTRQKAFGRAVSRAPWCVWTRAGPAPGCPGPG